MCKYKSKLICKGKAYYNIHHFNYIEKIIAKVFYGIKIEDCEEITDEDNHIPRID